MMKPLHKTYTVGAETTASAPIPVTRDCSGYSYALAFSASGGTGEVQYTLDDVFAAGFSAATAHWFSLGERSADYAGSVDKTVSSFRVLYGGPTPGVTVTFHLTAIV